MNCFLFSLELFTLVLLSQLVLCHLLNFLILAIGHLSLLMLRNVVSEWIIGRWGWIIWTWFAVNLNWGPCLSLIINDFRIRILIWCTRMSQWIHLKFLTISSNTLFYLWFNIFQIRRLCWSWLFTLFLLKVIILSFFLLCWFFSYNLLLFFLPLLSWLNFLVWMWLFLIILLLLLRRRSVYKNSTTSFMFRNLIFFISKNFFFNRGLDTILLMIICLFWWWDVNSSFFKIILWSLRLSWSASWLRFLLLMLFLIHLLLLTSLEILYLLLIFSKDFSLIYNHGLRVILSKTLSIFSSCKHFI